jgi:uncharacterized protein (TIGR02996 family)
VTPEDGFLDHIRASPDDDVPRLVYADWLDEHGDEADRARAELIRVECELARLDKDEPRFAELTQRRDNLHQAHEGEWQGPLREALNVGGEEQFGYAVFQRGFIDKLSLQPARRSFLADIAPILSRHPIRRLVFGTRSTLSEGDILAAVIERTELCCLTDLCSFVGGGLLPVSLAFRFVTALHLARLRDLYIGSPFALDAFLVLLDGPLLDGLTRLAVRVPDDSAQRALRLLLDHPRSRRLEALDLACWRLGDRGVERLAESPNLAGLRELHLAYNGLTDRSIDVLASSLLGRLAHLDVSSNDLHSPDTLRRLGASPSLAKLPSLDLNSNEIQDVGFAAFLESPYLSGLRALTLSFNALTSTSAQLLASCPLLAELRELDLNDNPLGDEGAAALASSPYLGKVRQLGLLACGIGDVGARALAASPHLARLRGLELSKKSLSQETQALLSERFGSAVILY